MTFFFRGLSRKAGFISPARHRRAGGVTTKTDSIFRLWERAARATWRGRGQYERPPGPRSVPRQASRAAPRSAARGRRENGRRVKRKHYFTLLYFGVSRMYENYWKLLNTPDEQRYQTSVLCDLHVYLRGVRRDSTSEKINGTRLPHICRRLYAF